MYSDTITLFNLHRGVWHSHKLSGVDAVGLADRSTATALNGSVKNDTGVILVQSDETRKIGPLQYIEPKQYKAAEDVTNLITFNTESDFIVLGDHSTAPIKDDDYTDGYYDDINSRLDGVYKIAAASFYLLIPHFEIEVR